MKLQYDIYGKVEMLEDGIIIGYYNVDDEIIQQHLSNGIDIDDRKIHEYKISSFKLERDNLLNTVVDHYQKPLVWEKLTDEQKDKVRKYREELLDCTKTMELPSPLVLTDDIVTDKPVEAKKNPKKHISTKKHGQQ